MSDYTLEQLLTHTPDQVEYLHETGRISDEVAASYFHLWQTSAYRFSQVCQCEECRDTVCTCPETEDDPPPCKACEKVAGRILTSASRALPVRVLEVSP